MPRPQPRRWEDLSDADLLQVRICDLKVRFEECDLPPRLAQLHEELASRALYLRPDAYLADEWFTPDQAVIIGVPFYLAHPRLRALELRMMLDVEGGTRTSAMRLLRHEAGHCLDHAFDLSRRPGWRRVFGSPRVAYRPDLYLADPGSRAHVRNLPNLYAQAHPIEDFAETVAVWLNPSSHWKSRYRGWPAMRKLRFVDGLMREIAGRVPRRLSASRPYDVRVLKMTLKTYYERKFRLHDGGDLGFTAPSLRQIFRVSRAKDPGPSAAEFLRAHRRALVESISKWSGDRRAPVLRLVRGIIELCEEHRLVLRESPETTLVKASVYAASLVHNRAHTHAFRLRRDRA